MSVISPLWWASQAHESSLAVFVIVKIGALRVTTSITVFWQAGCGIFKA